MGIARLKVNNNFAFFNKKDICFGREKGNTPN
jgi:hypothetical protein